MSDALFSLLLSALCFVESGGNPKAYNPEDGKRASIGLCQVQHRTAKWLGFTGTPEDLFNPEINKKYAAKYLRWQLKRYKGDVRKSVAAYNSGTAFYNKSGKLINEKYVNKVLRLWEEKKSQQ